MGFYISSQQDHTVGSTLPITASVLILSSPLRLTRPPPFVYLINPKRASSKRARIFGVFALFAAAVQCRIQVILPVSKRSCGFDLVYAISVQACGSAVALYGWLRQQYVHNNQLLLPVTIVGFITRMGLKQNVNHGVLTDFQSYSVINSCIIHFANQWHSQYYCCKILNENLCLQTNYSMNTFNPSHPYIYIQRMKGYNLSPCSIYLFKEAKSLP